MSEKEEETSSIGSYISLLLFIVAIFFGGKSLFAMYGIDFSFGKNDLESALIIGKSERLDFQKFQEKGGFENESNKKWRGYLVQNVNAEYDNKGKVNTFNVILVKSMFGAKLASVENLRSSLSSDCGSDWVLNGQQYTAKKKEFSCRIMPDSQNVDVIVSSQ